MEGGSNEYGSEYSEPDEEKAEDTGSEFDQTEVSQSEESAGEQNESSTDFTLPMSEDEMEVEEKSYRLPMTEDEMEIDDEVKIDLPMSEKEIEVEEKSYRLPMSEAEMEIEEISFNLPMSEAEMEVEEEMINLPMSEDELESQEETFDITKVPQSEAELEAQEDFNFGEISQSYKELRSEEDFKNLVECIKGLIGENKNYAARDVVQNLVNLNPDERESLGFPNDISLELFDWVLKPEQSEEPSLSEREGETVEKHGIKVEGFKSESLEGILSDKTTNTAIHQKEIEVKGEVSEHNDIKRKIDGIDASIEVRKENKFENLNREELEIKHRANSELLKFCEKKINEGNFNGLVTREGYEKKLKELKKENVLIDKKIKDFNDNFPHSDTLNQEKQIIETEEMVGNNDDQTRRDQQEAKDYQKKSENLTCSDNDSKSLVDAFNASHRSNIEPSKVKSDASAERVEKSEVGVEGDDENKRTEEIYEKMSGSLVDSSEEKTIFHKNDKNADMITEVESEEKDELRNISEVFSEFLDKTHNTEFIKEMITEFNKSGNWIRGLRPTKSFLSFLDGEVIRLGSVRTYNKSNDIALLSDYTLLIKKIRDVDVLRTAIREKILENKGKYNAFDIEQWLLISDTSARNCLKDMFTEREYQQYIRTQTHVSIETVEDVVKKRSGKLYTEDINNAKSRVHIECAEGHHFYPTYDSLIYNKTWCPDCHIYVGETICRRFFERIFRKPFPKSYLPWLVNQNGNQMELDGFNKEMKMAFEYQGIQHRKIAFGMTKEDVKKIQHEDALKLKICKENGVTLLIIPDDKITPYSEMQKYIEKEFKEKTGITLKNIPRFDYKEFVIYENKHAKKFRDYAENKGGVQLTPYFGVKKPVTILCENGHKWTTTPDSVYRDNWCSVCAKNKKGNTEYFRQIGKKFGCELTKDYVNARTSLWYRCSKGHIFKKSPYWLKKDQNKIKILCPECRK